jgi:hypothetical protein
VQKLKLFVVGQLSGNPEEWTDLGTRAIVAAYSPEQAVEMAGCGHCVAELDVREPGVLVVEENDGFD